MILAAALGLVVGFAVGGLGGGGGVLTVPALVSVLGQDPHAALTNASVVVGITAAAGLVARLRAVHWRTGLAFGALGVPAAHLGALASLRTDPNVLLLCFAGVTLVAAAAMVVEFRVPAGTRRWVAVVVGGTGVGLLTGFLGVGGGFLLVPVLAAGLRLPIRAAMATSLLVIALTSSASLVPRLDEAAPDPGILVPFTLAALAGTVAGKLVTDRLSGPVIARTFAALLAATGVGVAFYTTL